MALMVSPPPPLALVIGIDKYLPNGVRDLSGATTIVNAVDTFLQDFRVPKGQIKNLRNEEGMRVTIKTDVKDVGNTPPIKKGDSIERC